MNNKKKIKKKNQTKTVFIFYVKDCTTKCRPVLCLIGIISKNDKLDYKGVPTNNNTTLKSNPTKKKKEKKKKKKKKR